ncbi:MAG TPA: hypothetical protein VJ225_02260 [Nitrososphaeraceae archaeon]|nr:hypothetical protein [Nitrososphaeraceae archaeon]
MGLFNRIWRIVSNRSKSGNTKDEDSTITNSATDFNAISSLSSAIVKLDNNLGLKSTGKCAICVKDVDIQSFEEMKRYIQDFLGVATNKETIGFDITFSSLIDNYGYFWFILKGEVEDIVAALNGIGQTIHEKGFSKQLLAAAFEFTDGYAKNGDDNLQYLIYNFKLDKFYPFVPIATASNIELDNRKKRDNEKELKIMKEIGDEIPFEKKLSLWYPIWNIPIN